MCLDGRSVPHTSFPSRLEIVALTYEQPGGREEHEVDTQAPGRKGLGDHLYVWHRTISALISPKADLQLVWANKMTVEFSQNQKRLCSRSFIRVTFMFSCWRRPRPPWLLPLLCSPPWCCGLGFRSESSLRPDAGSAFWCPPGRGCWPGCRGAASACEPSWHWTLCAASSPAGPAGSLRTFRHHDSTDGMSYTQIL